MVPVTIVQLHTSSKLDDTNHYDNDECRHFGNGEDVLHFIRPVHTTAVDE